MTFLIIVGYLVIVVLALAFTYCTYSDLRSFYYLGSGGRAAYFWAGLSVIMWGTCYVLAPFTVVWKG